MTAFVKATRRLPNGDTALEWVNMNLVASIHQYVCPESKEPLKGDPLLRTMLLFVGEGVRAYIEPVEHFLPARPPSGAALQSLQ